MEKLKQNDEMISEEELKINKLILESQKNQDDVRQLSLIAKTMEDEKNKTRFSVGIDVLNDNLRMDDEQGGYVDGDIITIGGPTGNGKTLLASTMAYNFMEEYGMSTLFLSYEVNYYALHKSFCSMGKEDALIFSPFKNTTGKIDWIRRKIIESKYQHMTKFVVIDHIGFLTPIQQMNINLSNNYSVYITQIMRELKSLAVEEDVIIILPVHVVKSCNYDDISLHDIQHSAGIIQESDVVLLIAREPNKNVGGDYFTEFSKVILGKNRIGGTTPRFYMKREEGRLIETEYIKQASVQDERAMRINNIY